METSNIKGTESPQPKNVLGISHLAAAAWLVLFIIGIGLPHGDIANYISKRSDDYLISSASIVILCIITLIFCGFIRTQRIESWGQFFVSVVLLSMSLTIGVAFARFPAIATASPNMQIIIPAIWLYGTKAIWDQLRDAIAIMFEYKSLGMRTSK